jgi:hypothetical protein
MPWPMRLVEVAAVRPLIGSTTTLAPSFTRL